MPDNKYKIRHQVVPILIEALMADYVRIYIIAACAELLQNTRHIEVVKRAVEKRKAAAVPCRDGSNSSPPFGSRNHDSQIFIAGTRVIGPQLCVTGARLA